MHRHTHSQHPLLANHWSAANVALVLLFTLLFLIFLVLFLNMTALPAQAQNSVPPTARRAATTPRYAARLAHAAQLRSGGNASHAYAGQLQASYKAPTSPRTRPAWPLDNNLLYENGPINGTTDAWTINSGFVVSDTITVPSGGGSASGLFFGAWVFPGDVLQNVQVSITSSEFGGTTYFNAVVNFTQSGCSTNQYGFNVCMETSDNSFGSANLAAGTYWVNLANAVVNNGDPIYWDENSGIGCGSQGCPSEASETGVGTIPSEAFTVLGGSTCQYPPCQDCVQNDPEDNFAIIHNFSSNEDPDAGLAIDQAGKLYGATSDGGSNGQGLAYKLAQVAEDWIFTPLYNFLGGGAGQSPGPEILGPDGTLYGTANGGIQTCGVSGDQYCGVVYRLRPPPTACLTSLCSWNNTVIYSFTGSPDGSAPNGNLVFDQKGNLYGTTTGGGLYGQGTVYELTPSGGGWTERVIYSFTGQNGDGIQPVSLLLGQDGNLYGTTVQNYNQGGIYFQLVPSGGSWQEQIIASYGPCTTPGFVCNSPLLVQESSGSFYGIESYSEQTCNPPDYCHPDTYGRIFTLTQVGSGWQFNTFYDTYGDNGFDFAGYEIFHDLRVDSAGSLYATEGGGAVLQLVYWGAVWKLPQPNQQQTLVYFNGDDFHDVEVGAGGNLYGVTGRCNGTPGTVWQLAPP